MDTTVTTASSDSSSKRAYGLENEPNPFEQSFAGGAASSTTAKPTTTPGGTQSIATPGGRRHMLPPVASITSPSSLLPNPPTPGATNWGNSLRSGPLSPAMLQGPQNNPAMMQNNTTTTTTAASTATAAAMNNTNAQNPNLNTFMNNLRRSGITPGGSGSMFPTPGPATAAILGLNPPAASGNANPATTAGGVAPPHSTATNPQPQPHPHPASDHHHHLQQQQHHPQPQPQPHAQHQPQPQPQPHAQHQSPPQPHPPQPQHQPQPQPQQPQIIQSNVQQPSQEPSPKAQTANNNKRNANANGGGKKKQKTTQQQPDPESVKKESDDNDDDDHDDNTSTNKRGGGKKKQSEEEKRKSFLERNRIAALKCRQRKKQWLANLEAKVNYFTTENESLNNQVSQLREQLASIRSLLLSHKDSIPQELLAVALSEQMYAQQQQQQQQPQQKPPQQQNGAQFLDNSVPMAPQNVPESQNYQPPVWPIQQ
ncbi:hypothetical protein TRICI_002863 [Trichomonascus ciferrii]|uniref:BZIP domain-containing protein n=1 Tax=Trichomonascus ciferrii TaxID=44093 RepID=A0A642V5Q9_9ASCO|nr:hypothetical protein TRICI_002863 [Trichomonascus ciferrii]